MLSELAKVKCGIDEATESAEYVNSFWTTAVAPLDAGRLEKQRETKVDDAESNTGKLIHASEVPASRSAESGERLSALTGG